MRPFLRGERIRCDRTLFDIVQFNGLSKATSTLKVTTAEQEGMIFFENGEVVHALCGDETGEEAFFRILNFKGGSLQNIKGISAPRTSITNNLESLLLQSTVRLDEKSVPDAQASLLQPLETAGISPAFLDDRTDQETEMFGKEIIDEPQQNTEEPVMTEIQKILSEFTNIDGVHTACLVGRDGFLLDWIARKGIDAELIGAIASSGFGSAESMGNQLGQGELTMTMIEYSNGPVLFSPVGTEAILVIVADKETNLGWIRITIKKHSQEIRKVASL